MALAPPPITPPAFPDDGALPPEETAGPAPMFPDAAALDASLLKWAKGGTDSAVAQSQPRKREWSDFRLMVEGKWDKDDPNDELVKLGMYLPVVARFIRVMAASLMLRLFPDPATMDIFAVLPRAPGLEQFTDAYEALLREDTKSAQPEAAGTFIDLKYRQMLDWLTYGDECGLVTHEVYAEGPSDADGLVEGPCPQYLDPRNVWPWERAANLMQQGTVSVYDPISKGELAGGDYRNVEQVWEDETPEVLDSIDPQAQNDESSTGTVSSSTNDTDQADDTAAGKRYVRYHVFGKFPAYWLREEFDIGPEVTDLEIAAAACETLGIDLVQTTIEMGQNQPQEADLVALLEGHWHTQFIGDTLIGCRPYPYWLPHGRSPVAHHPFQIVNGDVWGRGLYDLVRVDERLRNFFIRNAMHISAMAAKLPFTYPKDAVDKAWLQRQGKTELTGLAPGQGVPVETGAWLQAGGKVLQVIDYNTPALPVLWEASDRIDSQMREQTGVTSAVEGQDRSRTATQSSNNLQQSMTMIDFAVMRQEQGALRDTAERMFVIRAQAMRIAQLGKWVPLSMEEGQLAGATVRPEDIRSLALVSIQITGSSSPMGRVQMSEAMTGWAQAWGDVIDRQKGAKLHAQMLGIRGVADLILNPMEIMARLPEAAHTLQRVFGQGWEAWLPEPMRQALQMQMGGGMQPGMAPAGAPSGPAGGGGMPQMGTGPMGPGMMGGGANGMPGNLPA